MKKRNHPSGIASPSGARWRGVLGTFAVIALLVEPIQTQQPQAAAGGAFPSKAGREDPALWQEFRSAARVSVRDVRRIPGGGPSRGSALRQLAATRRNHGVDGTGIGIGVISIGAAPLATGDAPDDLLDRVTVLPGQAGEGDAGMAALGVLRDLAPGAELYFASGLGGPARFAANVEALCQAGADVIVDHVFDFRKTIHQGGLMAQGIARAVRDGCVYVSAAGNQEGADPHPAARTCVTATTPDFSTLCGSAATRVQAAALAALILETAGGRHSVTAEELRAAVSGAALRIASPTAAIEGTKPPTVGKIEMGSIPPEDREVYGVGDSIEITVTFSEIVNVIGTPLLGLDVGNVTRQAVYTGGTGTAALTFSYSVAEGDEDTDGVSLEADSLSLGNGVIEDGSENPAVLGHAGSEDQAGQRVDGIRPSLVTGDEATVTGARLTLKYDEPLDRTSAPPAGDFKVTVGGERRDVTTVALAGNTVALKLASPVGRGEPVTVSYAAPAPGTAEPIRDPAGNESTAFSNQSVANRTGEATDQAGRKLSAKTAKQIQAILAAKAQRTPAQKKVSSELLDARRMAGGVIVSDKAGKRAAPGTDSLKEPVTVDIRADVTPEVLDRIRSLGGTVIDSVPRYRSIRARLPLGAVETLAELDAVQSIRTADKAMTRGPVKRLPAALRAVAGDRPVTRKVNTTQGDVAHQAKLARDTHKVDGIGIGIGVLSDGIGSLRARQASGDLPDRVTVLPGEAGEGYEGTAMLEIVHDLAPGAELYFATALGGQARFAANIEALCEAGADVIVDDVGYIFEAAFQDDTVSKGVNAAVADGCYFFSAGGNNGNLNDGTAGVWEGDYAAGSSITLDGTTFVAHDFGEGVIQNEITQESDFETYILQWADPLEASGNDYDLFLIDEHGNVLDKSTSTQDGTQDPFETVYSDEADHAGARLVIVKTSGSNRYLRLDTLGGQLAVATAGNLYGHSAAENAIAVAAVGVHTAGGTGGVFDGTESVRTSNSDGPRRIFFEPDGTPITAGNFSSTGGDLLQKPDIAAATCVRTATPGFSIFCGVSSAAPHAAAIGALMLEAAGGPGNLTQSELITGMTRASLDIEATGVDRDSGAGIVMAPGAVDAVDVAAADRNGAPTAMGTLPDRTFGPGDAAVTIDLSTKFTDPDSDPLTYEALSSDDRVEVVVTDSDLTVTPRLPSAATVLVRAVDPDGLSAVRNFSVSVALGNRDYDGDDDNLIDVSNLAQLDAIRYDRNGDGVVDGMNWQPYYDAFEEAAESMGCPDRCIGYELRRDLDFDTDGDGGVDSDDTYWNGGDGWEPIGDSSDPYTAIFEGNSQSIANLFIDRASDDGVGLFGYVDRGLFGLAEILDVDLVAVDVAGDDLVGGLAGEVKAALVVGSRATGQVSGGDNVGGLVGWSDSLIADSFAAVQVSGTEAVGGLVGNQFDGWIIRSYATGDVSGDYAVGGLVGSSNDPIRACYATGRVSGEGVRRTGVDNCEFGGVGGLVGNACSLIRASYATGTVSGNAVVGGLAGAVSSEVRFRYSYWDLETSGLRVGVGEDDLNSNGLIDGSETQMVGLAGQTTANLQAPTDYDGIYENWNLDVDLDGKPDTPWDFGTSSQYPVLATDLNRNGRSTWQEFGYQVRPGLTLTAATTDGQAQVDLSWSAVSTSPWSPAPDVSYDLIRDDGTMEETLAEGTTARQHTDTDVTTGNTYTYRVTALLDSGEAARSRPVSVIVGEANQSPVAVGALEDLTLRVGEGTKEVDISGAFMDPESDTLTYGASSSATGVATVTRSAARLTITPVASGRTTITATATDTSGSNTAATQRFTVEVWSATEVDYDSDEDGLIEIATLAQLDAVRHDLDGDGTPVANGKTSYDAAFADAVERMGCSRLGGCVGYELASDLDFDTDGDGDVDSGDDYWNGGDGWIPIGGDGSIFTSAAFTAANPFLAIFDGNGHTVSNLFIDTDNPILVGLFGYSFIGIGNLGLIDVDVTGAELTGGLVGFNRGLILGCYVAGRVSAADNVGGLAGMNFSDGAIRGSYSTAYVSGDDDVGGLVGDNRNEISASYATGRVSGNTDAGGLVGNNKSAGEITASYATGPASGDANVGGLVGSDEGGTITNSYWDTRTSGLRSGSAGTGRTTAQLQSPTSYGGIFRNWNLDLYGDDDKDDLWDFGTSSQYPVLSIDVDGNDDTTWEEFGYQLRKGPVVTATSTTRSPDPAQVVVTWTEVAVNSEWMPAPTVSYTVTRVDGDTVETLAEDLSVRTYTDSDVTADEDYTYQVAAVVSGGEATRSARVTVKARGNGAPMPVGYLPDRTLRVGDSAMTEFSGAFQDPEGDAISYGISSSDTSVVLVTRSGTRLTMTPVGEGDAVITVTATDDGSNRSSTQEFKVVVLSTSTTVDYDSDDDGLIEIGNLEQLDAVRHDLDGDGLPSSGYTEYTAAFSGAGDEMACGGLQGCVGYELRADLDFDTDNSGAVDSADDYWNSGAGWMPIGDSSSRFAAIFEGNARTITNLLIDRSANDIGLFGETTSTAFIRNLEMVSVEVTGTDQVGGLVGSNDGAVSGCFATGKVTGDDDAGGLIGANLSDGAVTVSYSTAHVTGDDRIGGLAGSNSGTVTATYATGRVAGDFETGGLIGRNTGDVDISYATGLVSGRSTIGGLVGRNSGSGRITDSYWDSDTSGRTTGSYGQPRTTSALQMSTDTSGIYQNWNLDLDGDSMNDDPWDFGTSSQYPVLSVDTNRVGGATWQEFGDQVRTSPALMATPALGQVTLTWSAVSGVTYNLYRTSGTTVAIISENTSSRSYVDTDVTAGATYVYQVAAVINGGEASRSARVSVIGPIPATISKVEITSDAGSDSTYAIRDVIEVTVTFGEDVFVTGTPQLTLRVGDEDRPADYESVTDEEVLFRYRVDTGDVDTNGVSIAADSLSLNGGTIEDGSDIGVDLDHRALGNQSRHQVDGIKPELAPTDGTVVDGTTLTLTYTEPLDSSSTPSSSAFFVSGGSSSRTVSGAVVSGSTVRLTLSSAVAHWETGIRVSYTVPTGMGAMPIQDRFGNDADGVSSEPVTNETPDRIPPTVTSVEITSDPPDGRDVYGIGEEIEVTVTFSETVTVTGTPRVTLKVGEPDRSANYESVMGAVVVFAYTVAVNDSDTDGVSIEAGSLSGGTIRDIARNNAVRTHSAVAADTGQKVDGIKPVLASTDGAVANGTMLTLAYSEALDSSSDPGNDAFSVTGGSETRTVTGVRVSGSAVELTLDPAVEHGETGLRVSYTIPTVTGANPVQDTAGNDADRLSNRPVTNVTGDTTGPAVQMMRITSNAGSDSTYAAEDSIEVTVTFNETVVVTGTPRLTLNVGGQNRTAEYLSVSGSAVKFEYEVVRDDRDRDGVSIDGDSLSRGSGTIRDGARNDATLTHAAVAADSRHQVDGVPPMLATTDGAVANGPTLTLAYSEPLNSSSRPATTAFTVTGGSETRTVTRVSVSGNAVLLTLSPAVQDGEFGLRLSYQPGGNPIEDGVGNAADELNNEPVTNRTGDTVGPTVQTVRITSNAGSDSTYAAGETIEVTVTFSETVVVTGTPRLTLNVGGRSRTANYQDVTGAAVRFEYQVISDDTAPYGVSIEANRLSGGTIRDGAQNNAVLNHAPVAADSQHQVDGIKPTLATSDGAVVNGTTLTLAYGEPLDASPEPAADDFTVTGGSETRTVERVQVDGSAVFLTLSSAVTDGESGLRVNYEPGSNPIQDTAGNDADRLSNRSVTNQTGDTTGPTVATVRITSSAGSDRTYGVDETIEVTVTFNETVVVTGTPQLTLVRRGARIRRRNTGACRTGR